MAKPKRKKKKVLTSDEGVAHIKATFNNTIITLTDSLGCDSPGHAFLG